MGLFRSINESMRERQHGRIFKIVASAFALILICAYFLPATIESYRVLGLEQEIIDALDMADLEAGEGAAVERSRIVRVDLDGPGVVGDCGRRVAGRARRGAHHQHALVRARRSPSRPSEAL